MTELPPIGSVETGALDFKCRISENLDETKQRELAKDVAALANASGGTILVGGCEVRGRLGTYKAVDQTEAARVKDAYERAVRDLCSPSPLVDVVLLHYGEIEEQFLIAANVSAFPVGPVGVLWEKDLAYAFPIRVGTHTKWLRPEQLAMLMLPELRRVAIMLDSIPPAERGSVTLTGQRGTTEESWDIEMRMDEIDVTANRLCLTVLEGGPKSFVLPLDDVRSVWKSGEKWRISIRGRIDLSSASSVKYSPRW